MREGKLKINPSRKVVARQREWKRKYGKPRIHGRFQEMRGGLLSRFGEGFELHALGTSRAWCLSSIHLNRKGKCLLTSFYSFYTTGTTCIDESTPG
jgi:hypothetical protein